MPRDWIRYLTNTRTDAGRALVEQGSRIDQARRTLAADEYYRILATAGITARDARLLSDIGRRIKPLLDHNPGLRLPIRIRTLAAISELSSETLRREAESGRIHSSMTEADARSLRGSTAVSVPQVIRPTDNWSFAKLQWPRIDGWEGRGYIPGDLYANCLWYYSHSGDTVVDPMAGSGMLLHVWEDQATWLDDEQLSLNIVLSDILPRGPYAEHIQSCDLLESFPTSNADYIILDPPYYGLVEHQYSEHSHDLANMDIDDWTNSMSQIAHRFREVQTAGGRCTVIVPNNRTITTGERTLFPEIVRGIFRNAGYDLYDIAYASRRTQQKQGRRMGVLNNEARRSRVPLTDISEVLTFIIL